MRLTVEGRAHGRSLMQIWGVAARRVLRFRHPASPRQKIRAMVIMYVLNLELNIHSIHSGCLEGCGGAGAGLSLSPSVCFTEDRVVFYLPLALHVSVVRKCLLDG